MLCRQMMILGLAALPMPLLAVAFGSQQAEVPKPQTQKAHTQKGQRVFEMWTYISDHSNHDTIDQHFRNHAVRLYQKHGIELVGFWRFVGETHPANPVQKSSANPIQKSSANPVRNHTANEGEKHGKNDTLVALLAFPSRQAAVTSWKAMGADPEWAKELQACSQGHLFIKSEMLSLLPTDYSPMR